MADVTNVQTISEVILETARMSPDRRHTFGEFCDMVATRLQSKPSIYIKVAVKACVAAGVLGGTFTSTGQLSGLHYKDPAAQSSNGEPTIPKKSFDEAVKKFREDMANLTKTHESALTSIKSQLEAAEKAANEARGKEKIVKIIVEHNRGSKKTEKEHVDTYHGKFETLLKLAQARENVFMYGPTGSGKTYIGKQLAEVLGLPFYFLSCSSGMSEASLSGRLLPGKGGNFEYWESEFVKAFENGGVFLIDEIDAADANVLLIINSALANNRFAVPGRREKPYAERHPDFVCIAAANTLGTGSDRMYAGRSKLDTSTLDRFGIGKVYIGYDDAVEAKLCPDEALRNHLLRYRRGINANGTERAMSSRFLEKAYKMHSQYGFSFGEIDEIYFMGWREDEMNKVKSFRG